MTKSKRLEPIYKFSESRQQEAARRMGDSNQQLQTQLQQLEELKRYRSEYMERYQQQSLTTSGAVQVQDFRAFLAKLDHAIELQQQRIEGAKLDLENTRKYWMESRTHQRALGEVMERHRQRERAHEERKEQVDCDELAIRAVLNREIA